MDYFQWSDALSVGNALIDQDHKELVNLVNELHQAVQDGKGSETLGRILRALFT